jgi:phosphoserine aminotransferase
MKVETNLKRVKMKDKETYIYITENGTKEGKIIGSQGKRT